MNACSAADAAGVQGLPDLLEPASSEATQQKNQLLSGAAVGSLCADLESKRSHPGSKVLTVLLPGPHCVMGLSPSDTTVSSSECSYKQVF